MTATAVDVRRYLDDGKACDTYDHDNYPVFVMPGEDPRERVRQVCAQSMQAIDEVYWLGGSDADLAKQFSMRRAYVFGPEDLK